MTSQDSKIEILNDWSLGLLDLIRDPANVVKKGERAVVIREKYPKAQYHYTVVPIEEINSLQDLNKGHVGLLEEFGKLYEEIREEHKDRTIKAGFLAVQDMKRLHMHIISTDMVACMEVKGIRTHKHWNSFTTDFFVLYEDILQQIKENGSIKKISKEDHERLLSTPLICNQCNHVPTNLSTLKEHLLTHANMDSFYTYYQKNLTLL